jgi:hypothetical protein
MPWPWPLVLRSWAIKYEILHICLNGDIWWTLACTQTCMLFFSNSEWVNIFTVSVLNYVTCHEVIHSSVKHYAMETYWGSGGIALHIFNLSTRWKWVASFTSWGKRTQYPLDRRLGGTQGWSGHVGEEKKIPAPCQWLNSSHSFL